MSKEVLIDIPSEYLSSGQMLVVQKLSEYFIDGIHFSEPKHRIRENNHICLVDRQKLNDRSIHSNQVDKPIEEQIQYFQLIIEVNPEYFLKGRSISISRNENNSNENLFLGKKIDQLYQIDENDRSTLDLTLTEDLFQRGKTILIEKDNPLHVLQTSTYNHCQVKHFQKNFFSKRDHLQSKKLMEIEIELDPEFFLSNHKLTLKREDSTSIDQHFVYRRPSKVNIDMNQIFKFRTTIEQFLSNSKFHPILLEDNHFIQLTIPFKDFIKDQMENIDRLRVELRTDSNRLFIQIYQVDQQANPLMDDLIFLPDEVICEQIKYHFNNLHQLIHINLPLRKTEK